MKIRFKKNLIKEAFLCYLHFWEQNLKYIVSILELKGTFKRPLKIQARINKPSEMQKATLERTKEKQVGR